MKKQGCGLSMLLQTLTSYSNKFIYIDRFNDLAKLGSALKVQKVYVDPNTNKMYGFYDECYSIIETNIPFKVDKPIFFDLSTTVNSKTKEFIEYYKTFFNITEYPNFLFPENRRGDLMNNNISYNWDPEFNFVDNMTGKILDDCLVTTIPEKLFLNSGYIKYIEGYYNRLRTLDQPIIFENMQNNDVIMNIMSSKVSQGCKILSLNTDNRVYTFYVFKSLLGPLTKSDKLTIIIRQDKFELNKFMVTFSVYKKKTKLDIPELSDMIIDTHSFMINLS